ncbi:aminopeptidase P family protein [Clostridium tagluense]|uniref:aminopeptidase P family protein n=1 Tax=Clostridium tagluense TaxID=360422 RepID=UPI001C0C3190|nr:aminopeptidase P family protein [Clostridium tagluense]MBU3128256.1 aminopeptidase P family protein [Clostridium tagluense]MCB2310748.1 aminopeptidase P family protein [Clostridium tagluense]MCB2315522.1 aminopeptidase P family protein [Clostridium tagluense]MCB2320376.1 aminopeptidase P family protein [Clostridium tagluense]MCB2325341.1 aminopeptidase P family protein [Clostridium tagluense]
MNVKERIEELRHEMRERGIEAYIVPSSDPHQSEYVAEHYTARTFITGFTGSAGTAIITLADAGLWTDGRYFIQAESQLKDTGVTLFKMGETGVPTVEEFLKQNLNKGAKVAFDGKVISVEYFRGLKKSLESNEFSYEVSEDLIDKIWKDRPQRPCSQVVLHDVAYAGESRESKLAKVVLEMRTMGADYYVISGLDDIAWLLNIRARDVKCNPLTIAYAVVSEKKYYLFIDDRKIDSVVRAELEKANVEIMSYDSIGEFLEKIKVGTILFDAARTSTWIYSAIKIKVIEAMDITTRFKAIKNDIQIENTRNAMVRDGVAMVKFISWLKKTIKTRNITEIEASDKIEAIRSLGENYYDLSFASISAYRANASMPHYSATQKDQATIVQESLYLLDSGAQYLDGTTDITRTLAVGPLTIEEKTDFTLVLRGMINLTMQRFLYGTTGSNLDIIARIPLWNAGMDYKHGTGHGVGFFLNVHEGPHRISVAANTVKLEKGMVVSNEPGVYKAGKHGIRIENLVVVEEIENTLYGGQFMKFETLTLCPIDLEAIDVSLLTVEEKTWLNNYHKTVFEKLSTYLKGEELEYLKQATVAI